MNVSIICACLVVMRPILAKVLPRRFSTGHSGSSFAGQSFSMASSSGSRARRPGRAEDRDHLAAGGGLIPMRTFSAATKAEMRKSEDEGIHVHRDMEIGYKPASTPGSECELVTDNSVWITSPRGQ